MKLLRKYFRETSLRFIYREIFFLIFRVHNEFKYCRIKYENPILYFLSIKQVFIHCSKDEFFITNIKGSTKEISQWKITHDSKIQIAEAG